MIWFNGIPEIARLNERGKNTMGEFLEIEFIESGSDYLMAKMPVTDRTRQPYGILHGGASCVLAETVGSIASACVINPSEYFCVGQEISASHLRPVSKGYIFAKAQAVHIGRTSHVWDIRITNEEGKAVCISRLTVAVRSKNNQ